MKLSDKVIWRKQLYHDWFTLVDQWGVSDDDRYNYSIEICIYKVFSWKNGFSYQIKAPNIVINDKKLLVGIGELLRYLYGGGCPCYYRLEETLMKNGMWKKLS